MAEDKKPENGGLASPLPIALILTILASLIFDHSLPYRDERPSADPLQTARQAVQDVDARLWQDPFAAMEQANKSAPAIEKKQIELNIEGRTAKVDIAAPIQAADLHSAKQIFPALKNDSEKSVTVLAVSLPGGPYPEEAEQRTRRRYAVLSGLANQGWSPRDEQHIGYFEQSDTFPQKKVPFEWWLPLDSKMPRILLLWVDESSLRDKPIQIMNALLENAVSGRKDFDFKYIVIGPNSSATLKDMLAEAAQHSIDNPANQTNTAPSPESPVQPKVTYYSAAATAAADALPNKLDPKPCQAISQNSLTLCRLTSTDLELMQVLVNELKLRRVQYPDEIVILSEWDTFYGRAMRTTFEKVWKKPIKAGQNDSEHIHFYSYMRGLDGRLPKSGEKNSDIKSQSATTDNSDNDAPIELPEGQSQKDYLRRLANKIAELDASLAQKHKGVGIAAIGVLGSDVYDKLMILQALRQHFPHMLFFTTDLDAIYSHPTKWEQTHNLLVAAPFGLNLRDELQGTIPPFRDNYQTALFFATQVALTGHAIDIDQIPARLFEIGRRRPILLPIRPEDIAKPATAKQDNTIECSWENWTHCHNEIQPTIAATATYVELEHVLFVTLGLVSMACLVSWNIRKLVIQSINQCLEKPKIGTISMIALISLGLIGNWLNAQLKQVNAEPFYWLEGVSIWPTEVLRLATYLFNIGFFYWGHCRLHRMRENLQSTFHLPNQASNAIKECKLLFVGSWQVAGDRDISNQSNPLIQLLFHPVHPKSKFLVKDLLLITAIAALTIYFLVNCLPQEHETDKQTAYLLLIILEVTILGLTTLFILFSCSNKGLGSNSTPQTNHRAASAFRGRDADATLEEPDAETVDPSALWRKYLGYCDNRKIGLSGTLIRVLVHSLVFIMLAGLLMSMGRFPNVPARGEYVSYINSGVLLLAVFATVMLTMWVVEHARLCERLIFNLSKKPSRWNLKARAYAYKQAVATECVDEWLDIQVVGELTKTLQPLIWGPMIAIGLMVLARSSAIDDWNVPWALRIVFTVMFLYAISAEVMLQSGARTARKKAIQLLNNKVYKLRNSNTPNEPLIKRIEIEIENAGALREGAFRPWYEWPLLQAFGGTSALILLLQQLAEHWARGQY